LDAVVGVGMFALCVPPVLRPATPMDTFEVA
jgi:hypothetical protein